MAISLSNDGIFNSLDTGQVLDLCALSQASHAVIRVATFRLPTTLTNRDVHISTQTTELHASRAGVDRLEYGLDLANANSGHNGIVYLGKGDDLDEGMRDTVEVEQVSGGGQLDRLGRVLFHLDLLDANGHGTGGGSGAGGEVVVVEDNMAIAGKGVVVLGNLVSRGLVLVEVVLAIEAALRLDGAVEGKSTADGGKERFDLELGLAARKGHVEESGVSVWRLADRSGRAREEFAGRVELGVDFNTYRQLPLG